MPDSLIIKFEDATFGWYDMKNDNQDYIEAIESSPSHCNNEAEFLQRLYGLTM